MGKMTTMYMHFDHTSKQLNEIVFQDINQLKNGTLQEFENIVNSPEQGACWRGDAANEFYGELRDWIVHFKEYLTELRTKINRADHEIAEWVDRDVSYHYTPESFEIASAGNDWEDAIPTMSLPGLVGGFGFKWGLKDFYPGELPWRYRLPPEFDTHKGIFGLFWQEETKVNDFDAGFYAGYKKGEKGKDGTTGLGAFGSFSLFEKTWTATLFGIPIGLTGHLLNAEAKAGLGGKTSLDIGGASLDFAGLIKIGIDAGLGAGADEEGVKIGPFTIGFDLPEIYKALQEGELDLPPAPDAW
jgi:uncharacterized protein YukE